MVTYISGKKIIYHGTKVYLYFFKLLFVLYTPNFLQS